MTRKFKTIGPAVVAVLAMSAFVASAAEASTFTASTYPTAATGESKKGNDKFKTEAGTVECKAHFAVAALSGPSETVTVTPTYTECSAFGFLSATVNMNGCDYVLHTSGVIDVACESTLDAITITASTCTALIFTQSGLKSVELGTFLGENAIGAKAAVTGIQYTVTKDGFGCPFNGTGNKTNATYTQNSTVLLFSTNGANIDIG